MSMPFLVRILSVALGGGATAFGVLPVAMPRLFGRLGGIQYAEQPSVATAIRSVGVRDVVIGLGLLRALQRGDQRDLHRWLVARTASDAGDAVAVSLAIARGERTPGFYALGALALSAALLGAWLSQQTR